MIEQSICVPRCKKVKNILDRGDTRTVSTKRQSAQVCRKMFFLDALASLKTMLDIQLVTHVFKITRFEEYYRVLQNIAECYRVLQSVTECYRV